MAKKNRNKINELSTESGEFETSAPVKPTPVKAAPARRAEPATSADGLGFIDDSVAVGLGLLCAILPRVVEPGIRDLFQLPKQLLMADAAAWFLALLAALSFFGRPLRLPKTPLLWPGLALLASILISITIAPDYTGGVLSIFARYDLHRWAAAAVLFGVTLVGVSSPRRLIYVAAGLLLGGLWVALIGIGEHHEIAALLPQDWIDRKVAVISKPGSTFGNRNMAAELIVAVMPICYAILAMAVRWWTQHKTEKALATAAAAGLSLMILLYYLKLTVTRSAIIGAVLGLVVTGTAWLLGRVLAERRRTQTEEAAAQRDSSHAALPARSRLVPLVLALSLGTAAVAGTSYFLIRSGFNTPIDEGDQKRARSMSELMKSSFDTQQGAAQWRFGMWASTWEAIKAHPAGMGAGNWRVIYPQYVTQREKNEMFTIAKQPIRGHQDFLQVWSEYGTQGFLALIALIGLAFWLTARASAAAHGPEHSKDDGAAWLAYGAAASLAAIFAICGDALFSFPLQLPAPTFLFAMHLGVIGAAEAWLTKRSEPAKAVPDGVRWTLAGAAVASLVFLLGFGNYEGLHERWMIAERGFTEGRSLQKRSRPSEGLEAIRRAIAYNPDDFQNHFIEALNLNSMGKTQDAINSIEQSIKLYPNLLNAWVNLAMFNRRIGNDKKMQAAIEAALKLKPDELVALNTWAQWLEDKGRFEDELVLLRPQLGAYKSADGKGAMPKGRIGYVQYRQSADWPADDQGGLLGAYKQALRHAAVAAKKLNKHDEAAIYLKLVDDEGVPNDRSEKAKRKEWLESAAGVAEQYAKAGMWKEALPYAKRAAELAENARGDLKRGYVIAAARNGDWQTAGHEASVTLRVDAAQGEALIEDLKAVKTDKPQDAAQIDAILKAIAPPAEKAAAPVDAP